MSTSVVKAKVDVALAYEQRADAGAVAVMRRLLDVIAENMEGTISGEDPEHLHQLRIAVRRTRTVQRQFKDVFPSDELPGFRAEFRWLQQATGPARDLDVYLEDLDAWLRVLEHGTGLLLPEVTCLYAVHPGQMSKDRSSMLAAANHVLDKYSGRPWLTPALREELVVVDTWDDLQAARAGRRWAEVGRHGRWLVSRPARTAALARLWAFRRRVRRRPLPAGTGPGPIAPGPPPTAP